jgi:dTDP-4-dehydrorhamnose 3,5-epimerase
MRIHKTKLDGAQLIELEPLSDNRGFFVRTFCEREFTAHGLHTSFVQHSTSLTAVRGSIRGMHFQRAPASEVKVVSCLRGAIYDVVIDLRSSSLTRGRWQGFELSAVNQHRLYIPEGFAHGFQTLTDDVEVGYLISEFYVPEAAGGVRFDDPAFGIKWPLPVTIISDKDRMWPNFAGGGADQGWCEAMGPA